MDNGVYTGVFNLDGNMGFIKGIQYTFRLYKPTNGCYEITELGSDLFLMLSSEVSIKRYFKNIKMLDKD